jgi:hypothetical protein
LKLDIANGEGLSGLECHGGAGIHEINSLFLLAFSSADRKRIAIRAGLETPVASRQIDNSRENSTNERRKHCTR